jgi:hypothetical protein
MEGVQKNKRNYIKTLTNLATVLSAQGLGRTDIVVNCEFDR